MSAECRFSAPCLFLSPATKLGQGYVFTGVCHSVNRGGTHPPRPGADTPPGPGTPLDQVHPPRTRYTPGTRYTPRDQVPPGTRYTPPGTRYTPWDQVHPLPPMHSMLGDTVNERAVRILLECNLVLHVISSNENVQSGSRKGFLITKRSITLILTS